jgi:hypothetical protein
VAIVRGGPDDGRLLLLRPGFDEGGEEHVSMAEGAFEPLPPLDPKARTIIYLYGASGSGKSHWLKTYVKNYRAAFPGRKVLLVSALDEDETIDEVHPLRLKMEAILAATASVTAKTPAALRAAKAAAGGTSKPGGGDGGAGAIDLSELKDTLLIADDIEGLSKKQQEAVLALLNAVATKGRHTGTTLLWAAHLPSDRDRTRTVLSEAAAYVIFPHGSSPYSLRAMMEQYAGIDRREVAHLMTLRSRSVYVCCRYPRYYVAEREAGLLAIAATSTADRAPASASKRPTEEGDADDGVSSPRTGGSASARGPARRRRGPASWDQTPAGGAGPAS